jgi:hypothetical protein
VARASPFCWWPTGTGCCILPPVEPERSAHQQEAAWSRYPDWAGCITATPWRLKASTHHT